MRIRGIQLYQSEKKRKYRRFLSYIVLECVCLIVCFCPLIADQNISGSILNHAHICYSVSYLGIHMDLFQQTPNMMFTEKAYAYNTHEEALYAVAMRIE